MKFRKEFIINKATGKECIFWYCRKCGQGFVRLPKTHYLDMNKGKLCR